MNLSVLFLYYFGRLDPMVRSWCMRYESKHTYFKQVAIALGNFINVPFTVADRHQKLQSFHYFNEGDQELSVIINPLQCGPGKYCHIIMNQSKNQRCSQEVGIFY